MHKTSILAAFAAVPALVAPAQAEEDLNAEQIVSYKIMVLATFVEVMQDESTTWEGKAAQVAELAEIFTQLNLLVCTVDEADIRAAIEALFATKGDELVELLGNVENTISLCKNQGYFNCPALRTAVTAFEEAINPSGAAAPPTQTDEVSPGEVLVARKLLSVINFVEIMGDGTLTPDEKADKIMELAEELQSISELAASIPAAEIQAAERKISAELGDEVQLLFSEMRVCLDKCQKADYYGSAKLRAAVRAFAEAFAG